ncbi:MAG: PIN domain-containing protein [Limnospira sp. PMC 1291.21]|uniref:type II toxin-antitoxin system VapC family toxin n=1 Tax=Limnospira TaxID=2596745 RepID=UPI00144A0CBA|nr:MULTISPECIES: PIN domain-containing protein [unclassified Limnospira]QJB25871.1 type II toxin-antitoxin system VapC family toxin [Limnospira fusiformis SAG 85.79]MDT9178366.1 PIN domain-containing protein [Limnospira sp. PMC 1238.20]MDT9204563.1 PIN domain-containing protein [Limnospira sp. PMC 1243.20]MDT9225386.1 PIN domain-containing protein [Limnospira sp. PMC 1279.21]MDT9229523.1 PIN domain-containing protein [Limnospira sp. PMC 1242.20]
MIRTFVDAGVLIYAARAENEMAELALQILEDDQREFASSIFLKLEVLPKAIYHQQSSEIKFYETFFDAVIYWANDINTIIEQAYRESSQFGLGAMDALHIAAAVSVGATEFITNEKPQKSIRRTRSIKVISIYQ